MSYILEALRKSQQDRELGRVPTLATQPLFTPRDGSRNSWIGIALGLAALAVAIALYAVLRVGPETAPEVPALTQIQAQLPVITQALPPGANTPASAQPPIQAPAVTPASAATVATPPSAPLASQPVVMPQTHQPPDMPVGGAVPATAPPGTTPTLTPPAAMARQPAVSPPVAAAGQPPLDPPIAMAEQPPIRPGPTGQDAPALSATGPVEAGTDADVPSYAGGPAEPESSYQPPAAPTRATNRQAPADAIPEDLRQDIEAFKDQLKEGRGGKSSPKVSTRQQVPLRESRLPPEVQERLPSFLLTVHLFDTDPAKRMVIIDGRRLRQGDATRSGILVEEIFPDGVALAFEGHRFFRPR